MTLIIFCLIGAAFCFCSIVLMLYNKRVDALVDENIEYIEKNPYRNYMIAGFLNMIMFYIFIAAAGTLSKQHSEPKAIDVYRNKTELIVTSVNDSPVDSTVVFKSNN